MTADQYRKGAAFFAEANGGPERAKVTVLGEVDLAGHPDLKACLEEALASEAPVVELELSGVSFIDITGIEPIIELQEVCMSRGIELRLISSAAVDKVLSLLTEVGAIPSGFPESGRTGEVDR